ncbi:hypothetical protein KL86PLE_40244 [uncultured Pleomorphomonas sp.]|uniref:Uncharacterized protein n=1 Tax=uncultured Pleomorphomonas sp. TaxID=442121 RepID=A0A212LGC5_9HYPH|nr:hypothetical protein KL86PLE_40244 [uncultured Pleomorphomonas sp.]
MQNRSNDCRFRPNNSIFNLNDIIYMNSLEQNDIIRALF